MKFFKLYILSFFLIFTSCVTPKIHNALITEHENTTAALDFQQKKTFKLESKKEELEGQIASLKSQISKLKNDSTQNGESLALLKDKYTSLSDSYDLLASKNSRYMASKAKEIKKLLEQLEASQSEIFEKEDELTRLSASLQDKEKELTLAQQDLDARSFRVAELESIINKQDSIVTTLKRSISKALIGLEGEGLTIEQRKGKVYISLEEDLLFASGKYEVNSGGVAALKKLAVALESQKDIEILVEGHTDSIPFKGKGQLADNWDLSVMRATSVVKVLTNNSTLNPFQLTAAGRAEFAPITSNQSREGRSANRRIDMILSPNLDDLFKLLE